MNKREKETFSIEDLDQHFRNMPDAFFLMEILLDENQQPYDWNYIYANKAALRNVGISRDAFIGKSFFELFGEMGDTKWLKPYYEAAFLGKSCVLEEYSQEVHLFVQVTCFQYAYGYAACFVRNTTQSKLYEKTLQSTTLSYREIYFLDLEEDYYQSIYIHPHNETESGNYSAAIDQHFSTGRILLENEQEVRHFLSISTIEEALTNRDYVEQKYRRLGPDGKPEWCMVSFTIGERRHGQPVTAIMGIRSIDDLVNAELEQQKKLEQSALLAEQANQAKTNFLSSMSHDMRTPLNIIIGMATLARLNQNNPAQILDCMEKIEISGKHLITLVNQVLDMAKIESGEIVISEGSFTIPDLMEQVALMIHGMISNRKHILNFNMKGIINENVIGDESRLTQVLMNIISNAVKYSDPGSRILIELEELPCEKSDMSFYRFKINDEGRGMSKEFLNRIFEPFAREEDSRFSQIEGVGLGMAITHNIVKTMGGTINIESTLGVGSSFEIIVPLKLQRHQIGAVSFPHERALVIDDISSCAASICSTLDTLEIRHSCTNSGEKGLHLLEKSIRENDPYTCIFLDYRMPEMDGLALAKKIKKRYGDAFPMVLVSAYDYSLLQKQAKQSGIEFFCPKPVFRSNLLHIFQSLHKEKASSPSTIDYFHDTGLCAIIAEDNAINATIAEKLLEHLGFHSVIAENGKEAVDLLEHSKPGTFHFILMDIQMPVMDGLKAARCIRNLDHPDANIPIFAMTANVFTDDVQRSQEAGMQEHIGKPIDFDGLQAILSRWFPEQVK